MKTSNRFAELSKQKRSYLAVLSTSLIVGASFFTIQASAQAFPSKTVTIVVPFTPGGGADTLARVLVPHLNTLWGQSVIVDYKPGASGQIGADYVSRANPDGYTLLMATTAVINDKNVSKFTGVSLASADAYVIAVNPGLPVHNVTELIAYAKANPNKLSYGSSGLGAASHLSAELFKANAGIEMLHVPYKGTGPAMNDLTAGHIQLMFAPTQVATPQIKSDRVRAIAVTGATPVDALPNIPTVTSSGLPQYQAVGWFGLLTRADTPPDLVKKLHTDIQRVMAMPEVRKSMHAQGAKPGTLTPAEFTQFVRQEQEKWTKLIKDANIVLK
jgi:tripartite-type tricarboxylate transporter receptor subunit TctC